VENGGSFGSNCGYTWSHKLYEITFLFYPQNSVFNNYSQRVRWEVTKSVTIPRNNGKFTLEARWRRKCNEIATIFYFVVVHLLSCHDAFSCCCNMYTKPSVMYVQSFNLVLHNMSFVEFVSFIKIWLRFAGHISVIYVLRCCGCGTLLVYLTLDFNIVRPFNSHGEG
jgi:hypothetical protein